MNTRIKQRLIGLLVFLLLAAIMAPVLFRSPDQVRVALDLEIPDPPDFEVQPPAPVVSAEEVQAVRESMAEAGAELVEAAEDQAEVDAGAARDQPAGPPPEQPFVPTAWMVQVASFAEQSNAQALQTRLQAADYNAFVREMVQDEVTYFRVFAGPELKRSEAEKLRAQLASDIRFKLNGLLLPYDL